MTEEAATPEGEASAPEGGASQPNHDAHLAKAVSERDTAKSKLAALESKIADEKSAAKEKSAAEAGKWQEVLDSKDATIAGLKEKLGEANEAIGGFQAKGRETSLMDRIFTEAKGDRDDVEASYLLLSKRNSWESAPEDVDAAFKERVKALKAAKPDLFKEGAKPQQKAGEVGVPPPNDGNLDIGAMGADSTKALENIGIAVPQVNIPGK